MKRTLTVLVLGLTSLTACGHEANGIVSNKHHQPSYTDTVVIMLPCGKNQLCPQVQPQFHDDVWSLTINGRECDVDKSTYKKTTIGAHYIGHCE